MEPSHNNHLRYARLPRQVPIHTPVPTAIHNKGHRTSDHSEMSPIPNHNRIPTSNHIHRSIPNARHCYMDGNPVPYRETIHSRIQDYLSTLRKDSDHHKR